MQNELMQLRNECAALEASINAMKSAEKNLSFISGDIDGDADESFFDLGLDDEEESKGSFLFEYENLRASPCDGYLHSIW